MQAKVLSRSLPWVHYTGSGSALAKSTAPDTGRLPAMG